MIPLVVMISILIITLGYVMITADNGNTGIEPATIAAPSINPMAGNTTGSQTNVTISTTQVPIVSEVPVNAPAPTTTPTPTGTTYDSPPSPSGGIADMYKPPSPPRMTPIPSFIPITNGSSTK